MNEIASTVCTDRTMSSREIAELTGKEHKNVLRDIRDLIEQGAIDRLKIEPISYHDSYGREQTAYELDFDATMTLVTGYNAVLRAKVVKRWRELEEGGAKPAIPKDLPSALRAYAEEVEKNQALQLENESLKPKAAFADAVTASEGCILVRELAKLLKQGGLDIGGNFLFEVLRDTGYLIKQKSMDRDMPTQKAMEKGLFEVQEYLIPKKGGKKQLRRVTRVTPRGQRYFINKFLLTSFYLDYLKRRIEESRRKEREAKIELGEWHYNVAMKTGSLPEGDDAMQYIKMYMEETGKTPKDLVLRVAATVLDGFYPDVFSDKDTKQQ